jgi:hypothetical protein
MYLMAFYRDRNLRPNFLLEVGVEVEPELVAEVHVSLSGPRRFVKAGVYGFEIF